MGNLNLFDVIQEAAEASPTLGAEKPEPEDEKKKNGAGWAPRVPTWGKSPCVAREGGESPPRHDVSIFDGVALTDFDAKGNPLDPNAPHGTPLTETPPTLADTYAAQEELDPVEDAETYGEAGPPIPEDPDPYFDDGIPDEICACMMVDDWERREYTDECGPIKRPKRNPQGVAERENEPGEPPNAGNPEQKPQNDSGIKVVRNATNIYLGDGEYTRHFNWPEVRKKLGVAEKDAKKFFRKTVPAMSDAELIALAEEVGKL